MKQSDPSCTVVVTVNSGSTSVKLAAFETGPQGGKEIAHVTVETGRAPRAGLSDFLARLPPAPHAIAHRVVHGGRRFTAPVTIDSSVAAAIGELSALAPLHNPKAVEWIEAARAVCGVDVVQVAAFDTAFFAHLPRVAGEYALPTQYGVDEGVRRYGFHGLAHQALWQRWLQLHPDLPAGGRLITLQMGGGVSAAAINRGRPLDTSMGFSPLEGLMMATRSGDVDPAVVPYLQKRLGKTSEQIVELLNHESGVAGVSARGTNLGELAADPSPQAQFAVDLYCYRVRKCIGAYLAVLGGCDGIAFGGGVGEHVPAVRQRILAGVTWAGIEIDDRANEAARGQEARIDSARLPVRVHVIPVDEERVLVEAALAVMAHSP
jgi:acetate kinase